MTYPRSDIDLYSDAALLDPFPLYKDLRDAGPAVWLSKYDMMVLPRYKDVTEAMRNWQVFTSGRGVMMNKPMNDTLRGIVLCSDDRGEIGMEKPPLMMNDYMGPSLDTTIFATSSAIWLFAQNPDQWDALRETPSLLPAAINEVVRLESPLQGFSRVTAQDVNVDGVIVPKDTRAIMLWGSANRDERKWDEPDKFDIRRRNADHVGFGHGVHVCVGMHLAKMEISALLTALIKRVERFELGKTERVINNVMHGFSKVEVTVH